MVSQYNHHQSTHIHMHACNVITIPTQIILFMEIEGMKRTFQFLRYCCSRIIKKSSGRDRVDGIEMSCIPTEKSAAKSNGPSFVSITPRSRTKVFGSILGVHNIDYILSDFEEVSVCTSHVHCLWLYTSLINIFFSADALTFTR